MNRTEKTDMDNRKQQRSRSLAIAWALVAMAAVFYAVTIVQIGRH